MSSTQFATPEIPAAAAAVDTCLRELGLIDGFRGDALRRLVEAFGDLATVASQPRRRLAEALPPALAERVRRGPEADLLQRTQSWLAQPDRHLISLCDPRYPQGLREQPDPPPLLWLQGDPALLFHPALAIIGSRRATPQGLADARAFARHLGSAGLTIVSGLAEGIDGAAHEGALDTLGRTVAFLGHGLDRIYPPVHRALAHRIAAQGLLASEYPLGSPALRHHFPERNRLISAFSLGTLVIEAGLRSGSLVTARLAQEQGRELMALPGSIHAPMAKGCHQLIREGASLVETAEHVWAQLEQPLHRFRQALAAAGLTANDPPLAAGADAPAPAAPPLSGVLPEADPAWKEPTCAVLRALQSGPAHTDRIASWIGLTAGQVSSILGREELLGRVIRLADGQYQALAPCAAVTGESDGRNSIGES